jgi:hypothetical protein
MRSRLVPVPSPGRASLVVILHRSGKRGEELDYSKYDEYWETSADGSSDFPGDYFEITADGKQTTVRIAEFVEDLYERYGERPAMLPARSQPCIKVKRDMEDVEFFGKRVPLEPKQFQLLMFFYDKGRRVPDYELMQSGLVPAETNPSVLISRLRRAFRDAARTLGSSARGHAEELISEILPPKRRGLGYVLARRDLFTVT